MNNLNLITEKTPLDMPIAVVDTHTPAPNILLGEPREAGFVEGAVMAHKLYVVRNRSYKPLLIVAETTEEALQVAVKVRHVKRASAYRKVQAFDDFTSFSLEAGAGSLAAEIAAEAFERCLKAGRSGTAAISERGTWLIDGQDTWPDES